MANELKYANRNLSGSTLYAVLIDEAGLFYDSVADDFVAVDADDWDNYAVEINEQQGLGIWFGNLPASVLSRYTALVYQQGGLDSVITDQQVGEGESGGDTLGPGADPVTLTIRDQDANPIADADVWVTSDSDGTTVVAAGQTDSAGEITFMLTDGLTYFLWAQKDGQDSIIGESFIAEAD